MFVDSKMGDDIVGVVIPEMEEKKSEAEYKKYSSGIIRAFSRVSTGDSDILSSCDMNDEHA